MTKRLAAKLAKPSVADPVLGDHPYPSEVELARIRHWPVPGDLRALFAYIKERWSPEDYGWWEGRSRSERGVWRYQVSTGGWSGNEDLLMALQANHMAWTWTWISSRVGGHYVFEVRKDGGPA